MTQLRPIVRPAVKRAVQRPTRAPLLRGVESNSPQPPSLASLAGYQTTATTWVGIPYGAETWIEPTTGNTEMSQVLDVFIPSTAAPVGGYPVICWFHANGTDRIVQASGNVRDALNEALAAGFAFVAVEFRHPAVNVDETDAHNDCGKAIQYVRSLATAFNFNTTQVVAMARSRGSLAIWQALQSDLASGAAPTHAGRQSSLLAAVWAYNPQTTYRSSQFASLYVTSGTQAAYLAANPDNPAYGSAINSAATAPSPPQLALLVEQAYYGTPQPYPGNADDVHFPDMAASLRDAYIARGLRSKVVDLPAEATSDSYIGAVEWFKAVLAGMDAMEAMPVALAKVHTGALYYLKRNLSNTWADQGRTVQAVSGDTIGALDNQGHSSFAAATQNVAADEPLIGPVGAGYGITMVDTSDHLATGKGTAGTGTLIAVGQCGASTYPAAICGNAPNATGTPGVVIRAATNAGIQMRLTGTAGAVAPAVAVTSSNDMHTYEGWWDATTASLSVDGGAAASSAMSGMTGTPASATVFAIGRTRTGGSGLSWAGSVVLMFSCDAVLSASRRRAIARFGALEAGMTTYPA